MDRQTISHVVGGTSPHMQPDSARSSQPELTLQVYLQPIGDSVLRQVASDTLLLFLQGWHTVYDTRRTV